MITDKGREWMEKRLLELPELVSSGDIARLAGVTHAAVGNWKVRYASPNPADNPNDLPPFPKPVVRTGAGPLYVKSEVEQWLEARKEAQA